MFTIKEMSFFHDVIGNGLYHGLNLGIPINCNLPLMNTELLNWIGDKFNRCVKLHEEGVREGLLIEKGYGVYSTASECFITFPSRLNEETGFDSDLFISALLRFDEGFSLDGPMGHGIEEVYLPSPLVNEDKMDWLTLESLLAEKLASTRVNFIFCVDSVSRPHSFYEKIDNIIISSYSGSFREKVYLFKGDSVLGLTGHYPFTAEDPTGSVKTYQNALHYVYDFVEYHLLGEGVYPDNPDEYIEAVKKDLIKFIQEEGKTFHTGQPINSVITECVNKAKTLQYQQNEQFELALKQLKEERIERIIYCGYQFPRLLGIGCSLSTIHNDGIYGNPKTGCGFLSNLLTDMLKWS